MPQNLRFTEVGSLLNAVYYANETALLKKNILSGLYKNLQMYNPIVII